MDKGYLKKFNIHDLFLTSWSHLVHLSPDTSVINVMQTISHSISLPSLYACQTYFYTVGSGSSSDEIHLLTAATAI